MPEVFIADVAGKEAEPGGHLLFEIRYRGAAALNLAGECVERTEFATGVLDCIIDRFTCPIEGNPATADDALSTEQSAQFVRLLEAQMSNGSIEVEIRYNIKASSYKVGDREYEVPQGWRWCARHPDYRPVVHALAGMSLNSAASWVSGPCKWLDSDFNHDSANEDDKCFYECQCGKGGKR